MDRRLEGGSSSGGGGGSSREEGLGEEGEVITTVGH